MTDEERNLIAQCGTFCHVTTLDKSHAIDSGGLIPTADKSLVLRGPVRPNAVYLCPESHLDKALEFVGEKDRDQKLLIVFKVSGSTISKKDCGADYGWLSAHLNTSELDDATIAMSLQIGGLACYELIPPVDFVDRTEVNNPRCDGTRLL